MKGGNKMNNKNLTIVIVVVALAVGAYFVMQDREGLAPPGADSKRVCICKLTPDIIAFAENKCNNLGGLDYITIANDCKKEDLCLTKDGCKFKSRCINGGFITVQTRDCAGITQF